MILNKKKIYSIQGNARGKNKKEYIFNFIVNLVLS